MIFRNQAYLKQCSHETDQSKKYSVEKQEVKSVIQKMGYDLETSRRVLFALVFVVRMNACFCLTKVCIDM